MIREKNEWDSEQSNRLGRKRQKTPGNGNERKKKKNQKNKKQKKNKNAEEAAANEAKFGTATGKLEGQCHGVCLGLTTN